MNWKLPNQLTVARVFLAMGFFVLLGLYEAGSPWRRWLLNVAFVVYIVAGITDVLDGYFARKWNLTSAFGRMVDPIVDKVLVVGAFAMLVGNNFAMQLGGPGAVGTFEQQLPSWITGRMASGVQAWMVVTILVRELVVSGVRGYSESRGRKFPATCGGKIKMFVQSAAVCAVLYQLANVSTSPWAVILKLALVWVAILVTVVSGLMYIHTARDILRSDE